MRKKRKNNGVKIFLVSTVFLFAMVFAMSRLTGGREEEEIGTDKNSVSTDGSGANTAVGGASDDDPHMTPSPEDVPETSAEEPREPKPDPADADNTWAMFLVNSKNKVSDEYCNGIDRALVYESWREYHMDTRMAEYMKQMLKAAQEDLNPDGGNEHYLNVMSAYRSIEYQQNNFDKSVKDRMENKGMTEEEAYEDTLKEVQLPGYSEHNAGIAADIMSDEYVDMDDDGFKNTKAYAWLQENAADYGFILRYPEGKESVTGIIYEPWHYRFVGVYYAKLITDKGITLEEFFEEMNWVDEDGVAVYHTPTLE
ncbi:MAG: M15 family metallopeptidase [Ruminococcus sp.]|nr:M15 family metallopeptidase [Ruminococcus sp.]